METSRIPEFYKLSVAERVRAVHERGLLSRDDFKALASGRHTLTVDSADKMIENVIGVMGLPVGLGLNFLINGKDYVVPLVVEEPSIVAALSSAAKLIRLSGGFRSESSEAMLIGQIQVMNVTHPPKARATLLQRKEEILNLANSLHPKMVARGGGAQDLEVFIHPSPRKGCDMLVAHLLVDTCDAMGANLVNTMCEGVAPLVEQLSDGKVFLRILSNLTDRAIVRAEAVIPVANLAGNGYDGRQVREGIIVASDFATIDPYRAATHNKGIMNGVDGVALATGNDWRAIEAGAHAYAARGNSYGSLTRWHENEEGALIGKIDIPIKVGIVGGPLQSNPTVAVNLRMLGVETAKELAEVMGAVGLAQNFAALRALATDGIQKGHMTLHARSVATAAGATPEVFDTVVERLIDSGQVKIWKAEEIIKEFHAKSGNGADHGQHVTAIEDSGIGFGKAILLGEHSVVYGRHAIAAPVPLAVQVKIKDSERGVHLAIPRWGLEHQLQEHPEKRQSFEKPAALILEQLGLLRKPMRIEVYPNVPRAMGLGGSAALAVAIIRALDKHFALQLSDDDINKLAFEGEKVAHGTPSGIDNAVATFGKFLLYRNDDPPKITPLTVRKPIPAVIGMSGIESLTAKMVARVRSGWVQNKALYERLFDDIESLVLEGVNAIEAYDLQKLGELMNVCQGLLNSLQVSSWELEELIQLSRENGALGAKLTGGGGGGSMIAICPNDGKRVVQAMQDAGYQALEVEIG